MFLSFCLVLYLLCLILRVFYVVGSVYLHDVLRTCCYLVFVSCSALNIELCVSRFVSLNCWLLWLVLYMCSFSSAFKCFPFLCILMMSVVSVIVTYLCPVLSMCCICLFVDVVSPSFILCSAF
jgi:hypothetical protein